MACAGAGDGVILFEYGIEKFLPADGDQLAIALKFEDHIGGVAYLTPEA
jgi:hypothetical protein